MSQDYHSLNRTDAHPIAQQLLTEEFWWDCVDECSPFGNDIGADTLAKFRKWRLTEPLMSATYFADEWLRQLDVPLENWRLLDEAIIQENLSSRNGRIFSRQLHSRDLMIISLAFAQLVEEGKVEPSILRLAIFAVKRQRLPVVLQDLDLDDEETAVEWAGRLTRMQTILEGLPTVSK